MQDPSKSQLSQRSNQREWGLLLVPVAVILGAVLYWRGRPGLPEGITRDQYDRAREAYISSQGTHPDREDVFYQLSQTNLQNGRLETAIACLEEISSDHPRCGQPALLLAGQVLVKLNRAPEAEHKLRAYLVGATKNGDATPEEVDTARDWLRHLLSIQLRYEERSEVLAAIHRSGRALIRDSKQYFLPSLLIWNSSVGRSKLRAFLDQSPDDPHLNIAHGHYLIGEGKLDEARTHLERLRQQLGDDQRLLAATLECHFQRNDWESFRQVMSKAPPPAENDPWRLLLMRGEYAIHERNWEDAVSHLTKLLKENPSSSQATVGLVRAYTQLGQKEEAARMRQRSLTLSEMRPMLSEVTRQNPGAVRELAEKCRELGLDAAAETFETHAEQMTNQPGLQ